MWGFFLPILSILFLISSTTLFTAQEHCAQTLGRSLYFAAHRGKCEKVKKLLESGADANYHTPGGRPVSVLHIATPNCVEPVLRAGADPRFQRGFETILPAFSSRIKDCTLFYFKYEKTEEMITETNEKIAALQLFLQSDEFSNGLRNHELQESAQQVENCLCENLGYKGKSLEKRVTFVKRIIKHLLKKEKKAQQKKEVEEGEVEEITTRDSNWEAKYKLPVHEEVTTSELYYITKRITVDEEGRETYHVVDKISASDVTYKIEAERIAQEVQETAARRSGCWGWLCC